MPRARGPGYKEGRNRYIKEKRSSGVCHVMSPESTPGKQEKVYCISYYQQGKRIFEKVGRHACASHLANSGEVDLYLLQRLLTDKDPKITARYAHLRDEALNRGANVMGRIVKDANESASSA